MTDTTNSASRVALVTGASSGLGRETAKFLVRQGYRVFGTSRKKPGEDSGSEMLELDVRSNESVEACVQRILDDTGRIDLLVNNAGLTHQGLIEETGLETAKAVLDTNFFGIVRMTNAVLPTMREQRYGRIINISSLAGLVGVPSQGFYSASKHALEGYSEALRFEVETFGIKISLIEPGFFRTNLSENMFRKSRAIQHYDGLRETLEKSIEQSFLKGDNPTKVARLVARVAQESSPRLRYRVGTDAVWVPRLKSLLPDKAFALGMQRRFSLS